MEIKNAKLIKICDAQEGVNKKGDAWRKVTAVVETSDHYPKTIALTCFNSVCETVTAFTPGALINVTFDVESRSWTDPKTNVERWFTEAKAWRIQPAVQAVAPGIQQQPQAIPQKPSFDTPLPPLNAKQTSMFNVPPTDNPKDDLPF